MNGRFTTAAISDRGGRDSNQDYARYSTDGDCACWVLADGLGGHGGGEFAASIAVQSVFSSFESHAECSPAALRTYLEAANTAVVQAQSANPSRAGMRTTLVLLVSDGESAFWAHAGDSRLYYLHQGRIATQTKDHSVPQALADAGKISSDEIRFHEDRSRLLRSVGRAGDAGATIEEQAPRLTPGDAFLLATDGFWEYVKEQEIEVELAKASSPAQWLEGMLGRLRARVADGHDNYSAIAISVN